MYITLPLIYVCMCTIARGTLLDIYPLFLKATTLIFIKCLFQKNIYFILNIGTMPRFITGKKKDIWNKSLYQMYKSIFDTVPMWSGSSCMVNDFPEPVCPYAKTVELYLQWQSVNMFSTFRKEWFNYTAKDFIFWICSGFLQLI